MIIYIIILYLILYLIICDKIRKVSIKLKIQEKKKY